MEPAAAHRLGRLLGVVVVTLEQAGAADGDLAALAGRQLLVRLGVDDPDVDAAQREAAGRHPLLVRVVRARSRRRRRRSRSCRTASRPAPAGSAPAPAAAVSGGPVSLTRRIVPRSVRVEVGMADQRLRDRRERRVRERDPLRLDHAAARSAASKCVLRDDRQRADVHVRERAANTCPCGTSAADSRSARRARAPSASTAAMPARTSASWVSTHPFGFVVVPGRVHQHRLVADPDAAPRQVHLLDGHAVGGGLEARPGRRIRQGSSRRAAIRCRRRGRPLLAAASASSAAKSTCSAIRSFVTTAASPASGARSASSCAR